MLSDKDKEWLLNKIDEKFPPGQGEPIHPVFPHHTENDRVHDLILRLIKIQGFNRIYGWIIFGLIFTLIVKALTELSIFEALVVIFVGLAFIYGIYHKPFIKTKNKDLNKKTKKI